MLEKELMKMIELQLTRSEFLIAAAELLKEELNLLQCSFLCPDPQQAYVFHSSPVYKMQYRQWTVHPKTVQEKRVIQFIRSEDEIHYENKSCYVKIKAGSQLLGVMIIPFLKEVDYVHLATILGSTMFLRRTNHALRERIKELTCLYQLNEIIQFEQPTGILLEKLAHLIPEAFQYPDIAGCCITVDGEKIQSDDFHESGLQLSVPIRTAHENWGDIQVSYAAESIGLEPVNFLEEETKLLELIAQKLAQYLEGKASRDAEKRIVEQLRHADRLATVGTLTAGIAHEINEPLANILGFAELAQKSLYEPERVRADLEKIVKSSLHAREIVKKLLFFSKQMPVNSSLVNLNTILDEGLYFLEYRCAREGIKIHKDFDPDLPLIDADAGQLMQVVVNLTVNSIQAMEHGGELYLTTWSEPHKVYFSIRDTGHGMNKEVQKKIFLPFFSTKPTGLGTGLGLSVVHGILKSHRANIEVNSKPNNGTEFIISFPEHEK